MKEIKDLPASVRNRLANIAKRDNRPFQEYFYYYVMERFLYRFAQSQYSQNFVLKGGLMFFGWRLPLRRPTRDIDIQGYMSNSENDLVEVVRNVCVQTVEPDDGLIFDPQSVSSKQIMEDADYPGVRVYFKAFLDRSNLQSHVDFSFGNEIRPAEILVTYPTILGMPEFQLRGYPFETAIAEKFQAMVNLETANSRMKDFYDIYLISQLAEIPGSSLVEAIIATFYTRHTDIPQDIPNAFSDEFASAHQIYWITFLDRSKINDTAPNNLSEVIFQLRNFLLLPMNAARDRSNFALRWVPGGPWVK